LAAGLAAGFAVDFAIGLDAVFADFAIGLDDGLAIVEAFAVDLGAGLEPAAAIAVPVIKKPEATKAASSFFNRFTSFHAIRNVTNRAVGSSGQEGSPLLGFADQRARDDQPLYLLGSFVDLRYLRVAHHAFDGILGRVPKAA